MRLGILSDIHEDVGHLRRAIDALRARGVDRLVILGDLYRLGEQIWETVAVLSEAGAAGVWGNHDFGMCIRPDDFRVDYGDAVVDFFASLRPRLVVDEVRFTHVEPWLDPENLEDLWWFEGVPSTPDRLAQSFAAEANRLMFVGHFHRWFLATPAGMTGWKGESPVTLAPAERYLVGVSAVCEGCCAWFDTETHLLIPLDIRSA